MKIAYIARSAIPSRTANSIHVMRMAAAYAELGHRVDLVVPAPASHEIEAGVQDIFAYYGAEPTFSLRRVRLARRAPETLTYGVLLPLVARLRAAHLVHSRNLAAAWGAACLLRLPTILELHDEVSTNPRQRRLLTRLLASPRLRGLVTITRSLADRIERTLGVRRPLVAADGVDERLIELTLSPAAAREQLGLGEPDRLLAVYTGHLYRGRGIGTIFETARLCPRHRFVVVGGATEDLERWHAPAQQLPNLTLTGFVAPAEVPIYLQAADVLLMPHRGVVQGAGGGDIAAWTSPLKMFEYLAAGRAILASTLPVLQEVLADGVNCELLPADQPALWASALDRLADDPARARRLGERARRDAKLYTWQSRAHRILSTLGTEPIAAEEAA